MAAATYLDGLLAAKKAVAKQEKALQCCPTHTLPFNKYKFFFGVVKSYFSLWLFGHSPGIFPAWTAAQFLLLLPLQAYRWTKMKALGYFIEFCWLGNFLLACYVATLHIAPHLVPVEVRPAMTMTYFAVGAGPLGIAVVALGNSLVPHSIDHMMSLLIHLQPAISAYAIRHCDVNRDLFPIDPDVSFRAYAAPPLLFLATWAVAHVAFFLAVGLGLPAKGYETTFNFNFCAGKGNNPFARMFGRMGDGDDTVRFLKYEALSVVANALTLSATFLLFVHGTPNVHFAGLLAVITMSAWNGAGWYAYRFTKFSKELDRLIQEAALGNVPTSPVRSKKLA